MYKNPVFSYISPAIEQYVTDNIYDPSRMSTEECIEKGLPYIDSDGWLRNTHKFSETGNNYEKNGWYSAYPYRSKGFVDFWTAERTRLRQGYWLGQLRVTNYFYGFLNYYRLILADENGEESPAFPQFWWIHFWWFHLLEYCDTVKLDFPHIKVRGCGLTEVAAAVGVIDYMMPYINSKGKKVYYTNGFYAYDEKYLKGEDKLLNRISTAIGWINDNCEKGVYQPSGHTNSSGIPYVWIAGYKTKGDGKKVQTGGAFEGVVVDKADKARGGRKRRLWWEESGANPVLGSALQVAQPIVERSGGIKTGIQVMWGTSNESEKGIAAFKQVLRNPKAYKSIRFRNVWRGLDKDKGKMLGLSKNPFEYLIPYDSEEKGIGWFIPYFEIKSRDKDGNPLREKAYDDILKERKIKLEASEDDMNTENDVMLYIADHPVTFEEALMVVKKREFDHPIIYKQRVSIETNLIQVPGERGDLFWKKNAQRQVIGVEFKPNPKGKFIILQHPEWSVDTGHGYREMYLNDPRIEWKLNLAGIDSIDQGTEDSNTIGSQLGCVVKKRVSANKPLDPFNNTYIAYYMGRSKDVEDDHEAVALLLVYLQAQGLLEYTKIGIKDNFKKWGLTKYLANEPDSPGEVIANWKKKTHRKGLRSNKEIVSFYVGLIKQYIKEYGDRIFLLELLAQLSEYTIELKRHYDLVAAMGHCEVLCAEYRNVVPINKEPDNPNEIKFGKQTWYTDADGRRTFGINPNDPANQNKNNVPIEQQIIVDRKKSAVNYYRELFEDA